jgi:DNA-binding transcriptional LysR family regulator
LATQADWTSAFDRQSTRGVQIRHLVALAAVARARSFRVASSNLGYVQSAVSQQVAELERFADARLFDRSSDGGPAELTYAGRLLLAHAEEIFARVRAAHADVGALVDRRPLRVGINEAVAVSIVPAILRALGPGAAATVSLREPTEADLFEMLEQGELELGFADLPVPLGPFTCVELLRDPLLLLMSSRSPPFDREQSVTVGRLAELPLIGRRGSRVQARIEADLCATGSRVNVVQRVRSDTTVRALVAASLGVAILPRLSVVRTEPETVAVDLTGVLAQRVLVLLWHRARRLDALAGRFLDAAVDGCSQIQA